MGVEWENFFGAGDMIVPVSNLSPHFSCRDLFTQLLMIVDDLNDYYKSLVFI